MRRDVTAALRLSLQGHLSLRKSRLESFCVLVVGVLLSRTVNLSHLACMFPTQAEIASNYRRLQRFFAQVILDGNQLARVMVRIAGLGPGPWLLALDRTCWKFGRHDVNILMLAIIRNGIAIPVMWDVLDRAGTSTTAQRSALLSRFCAVFGEAAIVGLIADREFIGTAGTSRSSCASRTPSTSASRTDVSAKLDPCFGRLVWAGDVISPRTAGLDHATARLDRRSNWLRCGWSAETCL